MPFGTRDVQSAIRPLLEERSAALADEQVVLPFERAFVTRPGDSEAFPANVLDGVVERWAAWLLVNLPQADVSCYGREFLPLRGGSLILQALSPGAAKVWPATGGRTVAVAYGALWFSPSHDRLWRQRRLQTAPRERVPAGNWTVCEAYDPECDMASVWRGLWAYLLYEELKRRGVCARSDF